MVQKKFVIDNPATEVMSNEMKAEFIDTYANLLYKAGNVEDAIKWEKKALELSKGTDTEISASYDKMRKGQNTWERVK